MKLLIPSAGTPVSFSDIFQGFLSYFNQSNITFESVIKAYTHKNIVTLPILALPPSISS